MGFAHNKSSFSRVFHGRYVAVICSLLAGVGCSDATSERDAASGDRGAQGGDAEERSLMIEYEAPLAMPELGGEPVVIFTRVEGHPFRNPELEWYDPETGRLYGAIEDFRRSHHVDEDGLVWLPLQTQDLVSSVQMTRPKVVEEGFRLVWNDAEGPAFRGWTMPFLLCTEACAVHFRWASPALLEWPYDGNVVASQMWDARPDAWSHATVEYLPDIYPDLRPELVTFDEATNAGVSTIPAFVLRGQGESAHGAFELHAVSYSFDIERVPARGIDPNPGPPPTQTPPPVDPARWQDASP